MSDNDAWFELATKLIKIEKDTSQAGTKLADIKLFDINLIPKIWGFIDAETRFAPLKQLNLVNKRIDFMKMKKKLYDSFDQFEADIKQFNHNCRAQKRSIQRASKELIRYVSEQIQLIKACKKCFENAFECGKKSITMPCSKPHLLLWIKVQGYSGYWPAKVMIVNAQENTVHVRFFGDYSKSIVSTNKCFLYSKNPPDNGSDHQKSYQRALTEATEYVEYMRIEFGHFNYAKSYSTFDPAKMADYLKQMTASQGEWNANADTNFDSENSGSNTHGGNSDSPGTNSNDDMEVSTTTDKTNTARKRSTRNFSINYHRAAKKLRDDSNFNNVTDPIEQAFLIAKRVDCDKNEHIETLKTDLHNIKRDFRQKNARLAGEKRRLGEEKVALMAKIKSLETDLCNERRKFADEKRKITVRFIELGNAKDEEKKELEEVNKALMEKNSVLESELDDERKKSNDRKKYFKEGLRQWNYK